MEVIEEKMIWRSKVYDEHNLKLLQMITIGHGYVTVSKRLSDFDLFSFMFRRFYRGIFLLAVISSSSLLCTNRFWCNVQM